VANERLRDAMLKNGLTPTAIADELSVDPKTAERWITQGRLPYPRYRHTIAAMVRETETYLWPDAVTPERAARISDSEIVRVYPRRGAVPEDAWRHLLKNATKTISILVYGGLFLVEQNPKFIATLKAKAEAGAQVEILLGKPDSDDVARRGAEEGIGDSMAAKIHNVMAFYIKLRDVPGIKVHLHTTTLYNSIFRFDDEMLVNTHVFGFPAHHAPVVHLRRLEGGEFFDTYADSFDRVWSTSETAWPATEGETQVWHG
jgi:hypothetical protein